MSAGGRNGSRSRFSPAVELPLTVAAGAVGMCGAGMILSSAVGAAAGDPELPALLVPGLLALGAGGFLVRALPAPTGRAIAPVAGLSAVTLGWIVAAVVGSAPYLLAGVFSSPLDRDLRDDERLHHHRGNPDR